MTYPLVKKTLAALSSAALLVPGSVMAASSWSAVTVQQDQNVVSWHHPSDLNQSASINTWSNVGNQAAASSKLDGSQNLWLGPGKGGQSQQLQAGARLDWENRRWPAEAQASTIGQVSQDQNAWSHSLIKGGQHAGGWLRSNIGATEANADFGAHQTNVGGVGGDVVQHQRVRGQTEVDGYINPSFPSSHSSWGTGVGSIFQNVNVFVQNSINW